MSTLEDRLLADLMSAPDGEAVSAIRQPPRKRLPSRSRASGAAAGAALIGALVVALLVAADGRSGPAYGVTLNSDGSVALTVSELVGVSEANQRLAELGIPVVVARIEPSCTASGQIVELPAADERIVESTRDGDGFQALKWVIHRSEIPSGDTIQIAAQFVRGGASDGQGLAGSWAAYRGAAPACRRPVAGG